MKRKRLLSLFLALTLVFSLLPSAMAASPKGAVGVSLPAAQRWTRDSESLKTALEDLGYDAYLASAADGDQNAQIEALLAKGIKVLVVCAEDRTGVAPVLDKAVAKGVKVIAYEQIPANTASVEAMVGFHSMEVGRQQAKYAIMRLTLDGKLTAAKPAVIDIIGGSGTDRSALRVVEGALEVLAPYIEAGMVADPGTAESLLTDGWTAEAGKTRMQALLKAGHKPDVLICGNDDLLLGAMEAMSAVEGLPNCHLVGRDSTAAVVTKIAQGPYSVASVFEDSRALAKRAAELADALARGAALPEADAAVSNGKKEVSIYSVQPQIVWTANYRPALIESGYYTAAELGVDPTAPVTAGTALSSLLMWDKTRVNDVEKRGQELDILTTYSEASKVGMDTVLSRAGAASILAAYCKETGFLPEASTTLTFADAAEIKPYFVSSMEFCAAHGIVKGTGGNRLNPTRDITRQEWGLMLARMAEKQVVLSSREPATAYTRAVIDAVTIEPEEVLPLKTSITKTDPNVTWNAAGDKVLVMTWNNQPEYYTNGTKTVPKGETVWVFTDKELTGWYAANSASITDLDLRLEQLIGLPPDAGYTTMTGLWVSPDRLARPAFSSDITSATMTTTLTGHEKFQTWFGENAAYSYGEGSYPWTRLGYTYDWADNGTEYGLTEFIIRPSSEVEVAFSTPTKDYFAQLDGKLQADASPSAGAEALNNAA